MDITKLLCGIRSTDATNAPLYVQIANSLAAKIQDATLPLGTKLPPERELARILEVSRTTAINAYRLLEERGLITTRVGSGTYVASLAAGSDQTSSVPWEQLFIPQYKSPLSSLIRTLIDTPTADQTISFAAGLPDPAYYPVTMMTAGLAGNAQTMDWADFGHISTEGYLPFRRSLLAWLQQIGIETTLDNILIASGSQQGLYLVIKTFVEPNDYVILESPTYLGAIQILEASGAKILYLPQSDRLDLAVFEDYLIRYRPKLFYTIPTFQNPTGKVVSLTERQEVIRLAARYRLAIIEDDPYSQLYYGQQPPPSLKALDTYGGVIYLGTFSKIVMPGLRTGWVVAAPQVINRLAQEKQYIDLHSSNLSQIVLHSFLSENALPAHLTTVRKIYKSRRDAMITALRRYCKSLVFTPAEGGFYLWCRFSPTISPGELYRRAATAGVTFVPGAAFYRSGTDSHEMRLCFSTHDEASITEGIRIIGRILSSGATDMPVSPSQTGKPII